MAQVQTDTSVNIKPLQFLEACSPSELHDIQINLESPRFSDKIKHYERSILDKGRNFSLDFPKHEEE